MTSWHSLGFGIVFALGCSASTSGFSNFSDGGLDADASVDGGTPRDAVAETAPPIPAFVSDPPGAKFVNKDPSAAPGLVLVSSRFTERSTSSGYFQEWLGEVRNGGTKVYCFPRMAVSFRDSSGAEKVAFTTVFVDAAPYVSATSTSMNSTACIAPGARGGVYNNNIVTSAADPTSIKTIEVTFSHLELDAVPDPSAPTLESSSVLSSATGRSLTGTYRAKATIYGLRLEAYPIVFGAPYKQLLAFHNEEVAKGATWTFETSEVDRSFTDYMVFISYVRGSAPAFAPPSNSGSDFTPEEAAFREFRQARLLRLQQAR